MYASSVGNQAYTMTVWMFADWISRKYRHMATQAPEQSPPTWTPEQWEQAARLEDALRLFGPDDDNPELLAIKAATPNEIRRYVRENEDECRADDGILRRFPDQLLRILLEGRGDMELDAAGAMTDALDIARNIRRPL